MTTTMTPKNAATMTTMITAREKSGKEKGCSDKGNNDDGGKGKAKGCSSGKTGCPKNAVTTTLTMTMIPKNAATMTTLITAR
jgi:flavoprotein